MKDKIVFKYIYIYVYIYVYILIDNESKHNIFFHFFFWKCSKKREEFDWVGAWSGSTIYLPIVHLYSLAEISLLLLNELGTVLLLKYWLSCMAPRMRMQLRNSSTLFDDNILTLWARCFKGRVDVMSLNVVTFTSNCLLLIVGMGNACKNRVLLQLVGWWASWMLH